MRIDFSEPECRNCYHCRTSGIPNTQESEPRSVTVSSVTSVPVHTTSPFSFGSAPAATTSVDSGPAQSLAATISSAFGSPSQRPAFQAPVLATSSGSGASVTSTSSTSSSDHSSSPFRLGSTPAATTSVSFGPTQPLAPPTFPIGSIFKAHTASGASATSTSSTSSPLHSSSPFGSAPAFTSVSSAPTQAFGQTNFVPTTPRFGVGIMQDPVQAGASSSSPSFGFGKPAFARPDVGISPVTSSSTTTAVFGATPVSVSSPFGPTQAPVQASASSTSTFPPFGWVPTSSARGSSPFTSVFGSPPCFGQNPYTESLYSQFGSKSGVNTFPSGFGVGHLPGTSSNLFSPNPPNFGGGSIGVGPKPFGFNGATTSSPFSSPSIFSSNPNIGSYPSAYHEWCYRNGQGSRIPGYAPTDDGQNKSAWGPPTEKGDAIYISISASKPYQHKSHEELRWEDYKQGDKGGWFPGAHNYPIGSRPNAAPTGVFPGMTRFQSSISPSSTTVPPINSSFQRPHETTTVPPPAPGCTACGATSSSSSTSGHFTFNGATTPPSAATTPPGLFFPTTGFGPMMFGTTLAVQGTTTPALQAYPVQGYVFLPFAAMSLQ